MASVPDKATLLCSIDGSLAPVEEGRISVADDGFLRGDGAFEVMRLYDGTPFALKDHLDRLVR
jgi:branched-chain amino acid aminotransferase